jgi:hypothetical protein
MKTVTENVIKKVTLIVINHTLFLNGVSDVYQKRGFLKLRKA